MTSSAGIAATWYLCQPASSPLLPSLVLARPRPAGSFNVLGERLAFFDARPLVLRDVFFFAEAGFLVVAFRDLTVALPALWLRLPAFLAGFFLGQPASICSYASDETVESFFERLL